MVRYWRTCAMVAPSSRNPTRIASAKGRCGPRCCSCTPRISGIVNSSHQTATVRNDMRTASEASASPNHAGLLTMSTLMRNSRPPPR